MNFNLVEIYNGLLRFNKHILNELAEGLKHLPNLDGVSKGVNHSDVTKDNVNEKCYLIGHQANTNDFITEFDFQRGVYFIPNKVGSNKKADYNWRRGSNGQDTDKAVRVLRLGGGADNGSVAGSGGFDSHWVRSGSDASVGFFTTVKLD